MSKDSGERLAIDGGTPVRTEPLLPGYPGGLLIGDAEKAAVLEVLDSQSLFRHYGPRPLHKVTQFEQAFATAVGAQHAVGVTSGTAALLTALAALGVGPGDEVIVPTYTWIATINAVVHLGAVPVFVDIDASLTLDPTKIEAAVTPYTKVILPVHMRGAGADMGPILDIAKRHHLKIVEDAAQALGGRYRGAVSARSGTLAPSACSITRSSPPARAASSSPTPPSSGRGRSATTTRGRSGWRSSMRRSPAAPN